mmetsp:Transcript_87057/g.254734  ORF Transcript_87057/g.254734 Transcript_87057/m.254734 type:complete len:343 (+) Transcript_87057:508-1536(+)
MLSPGLVAANSCALGTDGTECHDAGDGQQDCPRLLHAGPHLLCSSAQLHQRRLLYHAAGCGRRHLLRGSEPGRHHQELVGDLHRHLPLGAARHHDVPLLPPGLHHAVRPGLVLRRGGLPRLQRALPAAELAPEHPHVRPEPPGRLHHGLPEPELRDRLQRRPEDAGPLRGGARAPGRVPHRLPRRAADLGAAALGLHAERPWPRPGGGGPAGLVRGLPLAEAGGLPLQRPPPHGRGVEALQGREEVPGGARGDAELRGAVLVGVLGLRPRVLGPLAPGRAAGPAGGHERLAARLGRRAAGGGVRRGALQLRCEAPAQDGAALRRERDPAVLGGALGRPRYPR